MNSENESPQSSSNSPELVNPSSCSHPDHQHLADTNYKQTIQIEQLSARIQELEQSLLEERARAQTQLNQAETRFVAFMTHTPAFVWINDREGNLLFNNKILSLQNPEQQNGKNVTKLFPPEIANQYKENNRIVIDTNQPLQVVEPILLEDGTFGQALVYKFPLPDLTGEITVGGVGIDFTDQYQFQEQLRQSEERYRLVVDNLKEVVFQTDPTGNFLFLNPAWTEITGFIVEESINHYFLEFVHPQDRAHNLELFLLLLERHKDYCRHEIRYLTASGGFRWIEVFAQLTIGPNNEVLGISGTFNDITERRQAEDLVKIRAEQQKVVADLSNLALQDLDLDTFLLNVTDRVAISLNTPYTQVVETLPGGKEFRLKAGTGWEKRQFGTFKREVGPNSISNYTLLTGKPVIADYVTPDQPFSLPGPLQNRGVTGGVCVPIIIAHKQKEPFGVISAYTLDRRIFTQDDINFLEAIANLISITIEHTRTQEESLNLERQFLQSQKMESLGVLAGGIAHDFNNLLAAILGNTELAQLMLEEKNPASSYLGKAITAIQRAADLVQQLLAYAGKAKFQASQIDLNKTIVEMTDLLHLTLTNKTTLTFNLQPDLPAVKVDPTQIRQIIMNLLSNSAEAIGSNEGTITIKTGLLQVDQDFLDSTFLGKVRKEGLYICLQLTDTGSGMDLLTQARIFEPFFTTKFTGRGLGLSAVLGIIRAHEGALKVDSKPGEGTSFTILFPLPSDAENLPGKGNGVEKEINLAVNKSSLATGNDKSSKGTILIIEDDAVFRETTARVLTQLNYDPLIASDGRSGLEMYKEKVKEIDCVLLDLVMPKMSGEEVLPRLLEINPEEKVIIMSGYSETGISGLQKKGLPFNFLQKPFTIEALETLLKHLLEK